MRYDRPRMYYAYDAFEYDGEGDPITDYRLETSKGIIVFDYNGVTVNMVKQPNGLWIGNAGGCSYIDTVLSDHPKFVLLTGNFVEGSDDGIVIVILPKK